MLHLNDYKFKSVIFVISSEHHIRFANENLVLEDKENGKIVNQMPCSKIFCVFLIGAITVTSTILEKAAYFGFSLIFLKNNFRPYSFQGALTEGNTLLRQMQYKRMPDQQMAAWLVSNKISNQLYLLKQIREKNAKEKASVEKLSSILEAIRNDKDMDNEPLLGREGNASRIFFQNYFRENDWQARRPRVKNDPINTLMDIGYTFLFHFVEAHARLYGFDVYKGFYHRLFYQRKSLICDLVEPFRCIVDRSIRKGFNLKQFKEKDFILYKNQYALRKNKSKDYTRVLFEELLHYKDDIFVYIRDFYRAFVKDKDIGQYPVFSIDKKMDD